jgi:2-deoxy-D-gluconate 3-dehydrogenase
VTQASAAFDLTDRLAVVTGARRGIGLAIADGLAAAGADVIAVSAGQEADGGAVRARVEAHGRRFRGFAVDLGDRAAVSDLAARLGELDRPVDILVNNAGTIHRARAVDHPDDAWDRVLEVNLTAPFLLARELGAGMVQRGHGKVVFTASLLSFQGGVTVPGYTASKHGVAGLVKALANEWAPYGVNVNGIAPGYIATDNTQALQDDPERFSAILERIPAGRWGRPEDVAGAAVFLASSAADYVHGTIVTVDGGWLAR